MLMLRAILMRVPMQRQILKQIERVRVELGLELEDVAGDLVVAVVVERDHEYSLSNLVRELGDRFLVEVPCLRLLHLRPPHQPQFQIRHLI